jgi:hypothetical protein
MLVWACVGFKSHTERLLDSRHFLCLLILCAGTGLLYSVSGGRERTAGGVCIYARCLVYVSSKDTAELICFVWYGRNGVQFGRSVHLSVSSLISLVSSGSVQSSLRTDREG